MHQVRHPRRRRAHEENASLGGFEKSRRDVEGRRLASTVGPDQSDDLIRANREGNPPQRSQATEIHRNPCDLQKILSFRAAFGRGQFYVATWLRHRECGPNPLQGRPNAAGPSQQHADQHDAEHDHFDMPGQSEHASHRVLQHHFERGDRRRTEHRTKRMGHPAENACDEKVDARCQPERRRTEEFEVEGIETTGKTRQRGGNDEHQKPKARGVHTEHFRHLDIGFQRGDGPPGPAVRENPPPATATIDQTTIANARSFSNSSGPIASGGI